MGQNQSTENPTTGDTAPEGVHSTNTESKPVEPPNNISNTAQLPASSSREMDNRQGSQIPSSLPLIILPVEESNSPVFAATPTDVLSVNPDFVALKKILEEPKSSPEGENTKPTNDEIVLMLNAMARLFARFPTNETAIKVSLDVITVCGPHLTSTQDLPILAELQLNALEAFAQLENPSLIAPALFFLVILWGVYPLSLAASSNTKLLSEFIITALNPKLGSTIRVQEAISCGKDFVTHLMKRLSNSQLKALEAQGVYKQLRDLIANNYDVMTAEDIKQIVIGVGTFAEIKPCAMSFLHENSYVSFIQSALKYPYDTALQTLIWQLFTVLCNHEKKFAEGLFEADILSSIQTLILNDKAPLLSLNRFMYICCYVSPTVCADACLGNKAIMHYLLDTISSGDVLSSRDLPPLECTCDFLASLCKTQIKNVAIVLDLKIITHLENLTRHHPEFSLLQTCIAIESLVNSFPYRPSESYKLLSSTFSGQDHHIFIKDMLSNPGVISNSKFIKIIYMTFQKLLKPLSGEALDEVYSKDFLEFYSICFIRDTITFPSVMTRIAFSTHYYIFEMRTVQTISYLHDLSFHTAVANLLQNSVTSEDISTTMSLLACMVGKYYEYLKNVRPFLEVQVLDLILDKAMVCGIPGRRVQFSDDFGRIMLNMTADKELSLELYERGYLERLVKIVDDKCVTDVKKSIVHAIGNIALGGQNIKQVLLDKQFYNTLFSILRTEVKTGNSNLLSACCRVLHVLASGDWAKRKFVECGCIDVLLDILRLRKDTVEIRWRPLGLLSSLGFMAVTNRRYILTDEVIEVVASMLKTSTNAKVISYTTLVFLGSDELDQGARKLRELGVVEHLQRVIDNPVYIKSAPDLERWGLHVLEKQNLYTVSIPKLSPYPVCQSPLNHVSDWPPYIPLKPHLEAGSSNSSSGAASKMKRLLSLDDSCFLSHTPQSFELSISVKERLGQLGLDTSKPLFRIGRMYGSTHGLCSNCDKEGTSEELVIRPLGMTMDQYQDLIDNGWYRRGGVKLFRLRHNHKMECCDWETRVLVNQFDHRKHKSYKKVLKRMPVDRITVETKPAHFDREAFDLYNQYHLKKHDKPLKSEYSYCEHIVNTPTSLQTIDGMECGTYHQLYRLDGKLVAVGVIDIVPKGIVSIYMWYDVAKEISKYSFGVYSALKEIEMVKGLSEKHPSVKYYYLQGWNENNKKLNYKARYEPEEFYCPCIISEWTVSLEGVTNARKEFIEEKVCEKKGTIAPNKMLVDHIKGGSEASDGADGTKEASQVEKISLNDVDTSKTKSIDCETYPMDCARYKELTGQSTVDISKVVICLNYTEYMYLDSLFERYAINESQRDIIETRLKELYVALNPKLCSQLVIDMMASQVSET